MPFITIPTKDGPITAHILCSRRSRTCKFCHNRAVSKLCDFPVGPNGKTCDAPMCDRCSTPAAREVDYCPNHKGKTPAQTDLFGGAR
jgi:hypothetical protein